MEGGLLQSVPKCVCVWGGGVPKSPYGEPQKDGEVLKCPLRRVPQMGGGGPNGPKVSVSGRGGPQKCPLRGVPQMQRSQSVLSGTLKRRGGGIPKVLYSGEGPETTGCPQ